jgi:hypothetical protein
MSVDIEALIIAAQLDPTHFVKTPVYTGSVAFSAQYIRAANLWIGYDPVHNHPHHPDNPYHGQVWHPHQKKSFTESQKTSLQNGAAWYVAIPGVALK